MKDYQQSPFFHVVSSILLEVTQLFVMIKTFINIVILSQLYTDRCTYVLFSSHVVHHSVTTNVKLTHKEICDKLFFWKSTFKAYVSGGQSYSLSKNATIFSRWPLVIWPDFTCTLIMQTRKTHNIKWTIRTLLTKLGSAKIQSN